MSGYCLGIDLGGSSVKAVATGLDGDIQLRRNIDFDPNQQMDWARLVRAIAEDLQREAGGPAASIGLSAPGLAARDRASIAYMPGRLQGLEGLNWTTFLEADHQVRVVNDAQAALLGEGWQGAARGLKHVFMLTLGTGVGGAAMVDGRLLHGRLGRAGHLGHICLDTHGPPGITGVPGSLELQIGNCSVLERSGGRFGSTHELIAAHQAGDEAATRLWLASIDALACGIASLINVLDPEAVVIGGGIARAGDALFQPLQRRLDAIEWRPGGQQVRLLAAQLGEFAGAVGAAWVGRRRDAE
jgi:glucokinase